MQIEFHIYPINQMDLLENTNHSTLGMAGLVQAFYGWRERQTSIWFSQDFALRSSKFLLFSNDESFFDLFDLAKLLR